MAMNSPYTDPSAISDVLGTRGSPEDQQLVMNQLGPSPQNQNIAGGIAAGGLGNFLAQVDAPEDPTIRPSLPNTLDSMERMQRMEVQSQWLMDNQNERVPWDSEKTWGQYLEEIYTAAEKDKPGSGQDVVNEIIDQQIKAAPPPVEPAPTPPVMPPPGPPTAPVAPDSRVAGEAPPGAGDVPVVPTQPIPKDQIMDSGIMSAARGGLVRGYNQGGVVGEEEFLDQVGMLADQAGIPVADLDAVAEVAASTTGGPGTGPDAVMDTGIMQTVEAAPADEADLTGVGSLEGLSNQLIDAGEEGLAHVSAGEIVVPYMELSPDSQRMVIAALETGGIDPSRYTVGNDANVINEMTGLPAFGFWSKIWKKAKRGTKKVGKFLKRNAGTILGIAGAMTGNPFLAALGAGIGTLIEGRGIKQALVGAGMAFVGAKWVGPWMGETIGAGLGYVGGNVPTGEVLQGVTGGDWASGLAALTEQGVTSQATLQGAQTAAANAVGALTKAGGTQTAAAISGAASRAAESSLTQQAIQAGLSSGSLVSPEGWGLVGGDLLSKSVQEGIKETASSIGQDMANQMAMGATQGLFGVGARAAPDVTSLSVVDPVTKATYLGTGAGEGLTEAAKGYAANVLATPIGDLTGRAAGNLMTQGYGTPMMNEYMGYGIPNPDDVLDEWNKRYSYTPTGEQLYDFYTNLYVPNLQVNPDIIVGTPGYPATASATGAMMWGPGGNALTGGGLGGLPIFAAQGGYIGGYRNGGYVKGIGGPKTDENLARLSDGEFVFTEAAVRGAGEGDRLAGARRMYNMMYDLEQRAVPGYAHGGLHNTQFPSDLSEVDRLRLLRLGEVKGDYMEPPPPPPSPQPFLGSAWSLNPNEPQDPLWHGGWPSSITNTVTTPGPSVSSGPPQIPGGAGAYLANRFGPQNAITSTDITGRDPTQTAILGTDMAPGALTPTWADRYGQVQVEPLSPGSSLAPSHFGTPGPNSLWDEKTGEYVDVLTRDPTKSAQLAEKYAAPLLPNMIDFSSALVSPKDLQEARDLAEKAGVPKNITEQLVTAAAEKTKGVGPGILATIAGWLGLAPTVTPVVQAGVTAATLAKGILGRAIERQNELNKVAFMGKHAPAITGSWYGGYGPPVDVPLDLRSPADFEAVNAPPGNWQEALEKSMEDPEAPGKGDLGGMYENWLSTTGRGQFGEQIETYRRGELQRDRAIAAAVQKRAEAARADEQAKKDLETRLARGRARGQREFDWAEVDREVRSWGPPVQVDEGGSPGSAGGDPGEAGFGEGVDSPW